MSLLRRLFCFAFFVFLSPLCLPSSGFAQDAVDQKLQRKTLFEPPDVEMLEKALQADVEARYEILGQVTPRGFERRGREKMVQLIIGQLDDEYPDIRARAAQSLAMFGPEAKPALPHLMQKIGDKEITVTLEGVWVSVSKAVAAIGPPAIDMLMATIPESDRVTYYGITAAISEMGEQAKSVAPKFIELLRDGPENRRWATIYTLSKMGDAALPAIPDYIENLNYDDFNLQVISCRALAELGPSSKAAVPKLLELMDRGILSSRTHAAMCLGAIGPVDNTNLVELFSKMVQERNAFCQERGMIALGRLGEHAKGASELIERLIDEENFSQKPEAARTLWQVTGESEKTIEVLERLIDTPTYDSRVYAAITDMGPAAAPMAERLADKLDTVDQSLRLILVEALTSMGPAAKNQLSALQARIDDSSREVSIAIDHALAKIEGK